MKETKKTNGKDKEIKLVHTSTQTVAPGEKIYVLELETGLGETKKEEKIYILDLEQ